MEFDEKCKGCPYYKAFHPKISISVATFKCIKCGETVPCFDAFKVEVERKILFWKYKKYIGNMCRKCSTEEMQDQKVKVTQ